MKSSNKKWKENYKLILFIVLGVFIVLNIIYLTKFWGELSDKQEDFGYYGSFIGGVIGAVIPLVTVMILIETLNEQKSSSSEQKSFYNNQADYMKEQVDLSKAQKILYINQSDHMKMQKEFLETQILAEKIKQFDTRFTMMLQLHRENVSEMKIEESRDANGANIAVTGRTLFVKMVNEFKKIFEQVSLEGKDKINIAYCALFYGLRTNFYNMLENKGRKDLIKNIKKSLYDDGSERNDIRDTELGYLPFEGHQERLGHYFRHLWQTVNYIDSFNFYDDDGKNDIERKKYAKMLRGQLSNHEQLLLALNAISELGNHAWMIEIPKTNKKGEPIGLLEYYELIKNIPKDFFDFELKEYFIMTFEWEERENRNKISVAE